MSHFTDRELQVLHDLVAEKIVSIMDESEDGEKKVPKRLYKLYDKLNLLTAVPSLANQRRNAGKEKIDG